MHIEIAQGHEFYAVVGLVEELLAETLEQGEDLPWIDREKLHHDIRHNLDAGPAARPAPGGLLAILAKDEGGLAVGLLLLTQCFAVHAGGDYGVIDELYVRPEYRGNDLERELLDEAVAICQRRGWVRLDVSGPEASPSERAQRFSRQLGL